MQSEQALFISGRGPGLEVAQNSRPCPLSGGGYRCGMAESRFMEDRVFRLGGERPCVIHMRFRSDPDPGVGRSVQQENIALPCRGGLRGGGVPLEDDPPVLRPRHPPDLVDRLMEDAEKQEPPPEPAPEPGG